MGFQPGWRFGTVVEVRFDGGRVVGRVDHAQHMAALRAAIEIGSVPDPDGARGSETWVERTFTLDSSRSFGVDPREEST